MRTKLKFRRTIRSFSFILLYFFSQSILFSQTDHEFWFAAPAITSKTIPPSTRNDTNLNRPVRIYYTTAEGPATVKIEQPANPNFIPIIKVVNNDSAREVDLTPFLDIIENKPANTILPFGLRITSDKRISAFYEVQSRKNAAAYTLAGKNALGYEFIIPSQNHWSNYEWSDPPARNVFDIVATEDSTTIQVFPKAALIGHPANDTFSIMLHRGQTWSGRAASGDSLAHLGGSFVFSDKPIAVTVTDDLIFHPGTDSTAYDVAGDQVLPRNVAGTEFILRTDPYDENWVYPRPRTMVYAFEDSTFITYYDSNSFQNPMLNRGEYAEFLMPNFYILPVTPFVAHITSTKPVMVYGMTFFAQQQTGLGSLPCPQTSSCIVYPVNNCSGSHKVTFTYTPPFCVWQNQPHFALYFYTRNGSQVNFTSNPWWVIGNISNWAPVPGTNGEWVWGSNGLIIPQGYETWIVANSASRFMMHTTADSFINDSTGYAKITFNADATSLNLGTARKICPGDSTLLDAGIGLSSYLWNTGEQTPSIWVKLPGTYWVQAIDGDCILNDTIAISFYWTKSVNLGPDTVLCAGDSVLLDAGNKRGWYLWNTGDTTQTIWAKNPGTYWVRVQDAHCIISDTVTIGIITSVDIGTDRTMCPFDSVMLDAGAGMSSYLWNTGATTQTIWARTAGLYSVMVHKGSCIFYDSAFVNYLPFPVVNLGPDVSICNGDSVTFNAGACAGCTFQWGNLTTGNLNIGSSQTYTADSAGVYKVIVIGTNGCFNGDTIQLFTYPKDTVMVSIASDTNNICSGTPVTFTATPTNPGNSPIYQWKVNGVTAGTNSPVFTYVPVTGDMVTCDLTSSITTCLSNNPASSNTVSMIVNPNLPVSVAVNISPNPVCSGLPVTCIANPVNGGTSPFFQWKINGINVGPNNPTYIFIPASGDLVSCTLVSSEQCTVNNPASSIEYQVIVNPILPVSISITITPNPVCSGLPVICTAIPVNGGTNPSYQWKVNAVNAGINSPSFSFIPVSGDLVSCTLTSSEQCTVNNPASSIEHPVSVSPSPQVTFTPCFDTITTLNAQRIKLKGGIPLGGTYSGPGVSNGYFYPNLAGTGTKTITYSYTNFALCSASASRSVINYQLSVINCGSTLTDIRDGKIYATVQIGSQCWFAENLNYGTEIPETIYQRDNCINERYRHPASSIQHPASVYQWDELMCYGDASGTQGLCPPGWHVPTEADWQILFSFYQGPGFAASPLLSSGYSGFNAEVVGVRHQTIQWDFTGFATFFWSSTPHGNYKAWAHGMNNVFDDHSVSWYPASRSNAFSVRCLKD